MYALSKAPTQLLLSPLTREIIFGIQHNYYVAIRESMPKHFLKYIAWDYIMSIKEYVIAAPA